MSKWIEHRTGIMSAVRHFMAEPIPASTGWRNTLGSLAGALLLAQVLTGFLLALYYVPHPEAAYESVEYIKEGVMAGGLVVALHYWGASFIVVALFVHMCRVFYTGAYRKPRELTWLVGVLLFGIVMAFAFTGQLLPWNKAGYWAANVGIQIASSAPVLGPYIQKLITGGETLGALTLSRFYAVHVILLPAALGLFVALHLYLLRKHGPARDSSDQTDATVSFFPLQMTRDLVAISVGFIALIAVALIVGPPEVTPPDPSDTSYVPRPEWYFMSHFEILRLTPGFMKILATFVLPNIFLILLVALPWLDRARSAATKERRVLIGAGSAVIASIIILTIIGVATSPGQSHEAQAASGAYDMVAAGEALFTEKNCTNCHAIRGVGKDVGPDLKSTGFRLKEDYLRAWLKDPKAFIPNTGMPATDATSQQIDELVAFLMTLKDRP